MYCVSQKVPPTNGPSLVVMKNVHSKTDTTEYFFKKGLPFSTFYAPSFFFSWFIVILLLRPHARASHVISSVRFLTNHGIPIRTGWDCNNFGKYRFEILGGAGFSLPEQKHGLSQEAKVG